MTIHLITAGEYQDQKNWPELWIKCFNSLSKTKHDICIWTDEGIDKLLKEDDEEFYKEYLKKLDPIYVWDYVRYIILEKFGGTYFDMDIELIDESFIDKLSSKKMYLMEGTSGTYIENSIIISPPTGINKHIWQRIKLFAKNNIINKFKECNNPYNVVWIVGAQLLSQFFIKHLPKGNPRNYYDILAWEHFGNVDSTLNYTKHWQTNTWSKNGFEITPN
jgi:mannosyltransferase OCH1-like enzyme